MKGPATGRRLARAFGAFGAVAGGLGVVLAAVAAHGPGGGNLETASRFLLLHAPALLATAALVELRLARRRVALGAAALMAAGLVLFCGDLAVRAIWGIAPLRLAAPVGGGMLIVAWLVLAAALLAGGDEAKS